MHRIKPFKNSQHTQEPTQSTKTQQPPSPSHPTTRAHPNTQNAPPSQHVHRNPRARVIRKRVLLGDRWRSVGGAHLTRRHVKIHPATVSCAPRGPPTPPFPPPHPAALPHFFSMNEKFQGGGGADFYATPPCHGHSFSRVFPHAFPHFFFRALFRCRRLSNVTLDGCR